MEIILLLLLLSHLHKFPQPDQACSRLKLYAGTSLPRYYLWGRTAISRKIDPMFPQCSMYINIQSKHIKATFSRHRSASLVAASLRRDASQVWVPSWGTAARRTRLSHGPRACWALLTTTTPSCSTARSEAVPHRKTYDRSAERVPSF